MRKYWTLILFVFACSCQETLEPEPVNVLSTDLVLTDPDDVPSVEIGLYNAVRGMASPTVIAGDFTADMIIHNGTFTQYRELGTKQLTTSNSAVEALWGAVYRTVYTANFVLEKLPGLTGVPAGRKAEVLATARFLRGYAYFIAAYTYGDLPLITTTELAANRDVPKTPKAEILQFVLEDYTAALGELTDEPANVGYASNHAVRAALARYYLYAGNWALAEQFASEVISSGTYTLAPDFATVVQTDFPSESILEMGYSVSDDPQTSAFGLNNLFVGRREVIPSNQVTRALTSPEAGSRIATIALNLEQVQGNDNGWTIQKYGSADEENNNIVYFRLAEQYLIRAEARAQQNKINGAGSAEEDLNVLRARAGAPSVTANTQAQMLQVIERERLYELAYEGHRWYDLVRTGRVTAVMSAFSTNWREAYNVWPIPQSEIQRNPALANAQNPGYN